MGFDLVSVGRLARSLRRRDGFERRYFSESERRECESSADAERGYAVRLAAKEAFLKATGFGTLAAVPLAEIEVQAPRGGVARLVLGSGARKLMRAVQAEQAFVTLTATAGVAAAFVVLVGEGGRDGEAGAHHGS